MGRLFLRHKPQSVKAGLTLTRRHEIFFKRLHDFTQGAIGWPNP